MKNNIIIIFVFLCSFLGAKAQSPAQEVTYGSTRNYFIDVTKVTAAAGINTFHWKLVRQDGNPLDKGIVLTYPDDSGSNNDHHNIEISWNGTVGAVYLLEAVLEDKNGCYSERVQLEVTIMPENATLAFTEADDPGNLLTVCSYNGGGEAKYLTVKYTGAKPWDLFYKRVKADGTEEDLNQKNITTDEVTLNISIDDFFVNTEVTDREWKIVLIKAVSTSDAHETTPDVVNERTIVVHPLPVINGGIVMN
ncbi:MAG: hypothetical protein ACEPOZ_00200 [Marinifilaceae bacterium]